MDEFEEKKPSSGNWRKCRFCDRIYIPDKRRFTVYCSEECQQAAKNVDMADYKIRKIVKAEAKARKKNVKEITRLSKEANKKHISYGQMIAKENAPHFDRETKTWNF